MNPNIQPQAQASQAPQVIVHVHNHESKWLRRLVLFLLFGWFYPLVVVLKWSIKVSWKVFIAYPWKWTIALCVLSWRASVAGVRLAWPTVQRVSMATYAALRQGAISFHARFGMRGVAIAGASAGGLIIVLAIIGMLTSH